MKTVSIFGAGWLGLDLALKLQNTYKLNLSTTKVSKFERFKTLGFNSFILDDENLFSLEEFLCCEYLIICIPPSKSKNYLLLLSLISKKIKKDTKVIFISSTSIYPKDENTYKEDFKIDNNEKNILLKAENIFLNKNTIIFRCSGLMGYDRIAGKYFANKSLDCAKQKTNYVHKDDVIRAIIFAIEKNLNGIYNLCSKKHFEKKELYDFNALKYNFEKVKFEKTKEYEKRIIDSKKLRNEGFEYLYDSSKEFI